MLHPHHRGIELLTKWAVILKESRGQHTKHSLLKTMTNNTFTFTPSTQILEAAKQAKALANAGKALNPFFSTEIQETVDGVDKIANALNSTGEALKHFGFDEDEADEIVGGDVAKEGKNVLQKTAIKGLSKKIQGPARLVAGAQGALEGYIDPNKIEEDSQTKIREAEQKGEGGRARTYHALSPVSTAEEDLKATAQRIHNDPNSTEAQKIISKVGHGITYVVNRTVLAPVTFGESVARFFTSIFDEDESERPEAGGQENQNHAAIRNRVFGSTPETLAPIDLNSLVITNAYQQQDGPGADLIGCQMNQGANPFQAQNDKYAVLA